MSIRATHFLPVRENRGSGGGVGKVIGSEGEGIGGSEWALVFGSKGSEAGEVRVWRGRRSRGSDRNRSRE